MNAATVQYQNSEYAIQVGISDSFYNKKNLTGSNAALIQFLTANRTPDELIKHIAINGGAFTPAVFDGTRKRENFLQSQLIVLDIDAGTTLEQLQQTDIYDTACYIGETASSTPEHPRWRVIFLLDESITCADEYETLVNAVLTRYAVLNPDRACKDAARFFYGAADKPYYYNPDNRLSVSTIRGWIPSPKPTRQPVQPLQPTAPTKYAKTALDGIYSAVSGAVVGTRHNTTIIESLHGFSLVKAGIADKEPMQNTIKHAAMVAGLPERETDDILKWAWDKATARRVSLNVAGVLGASDVARETSYKLNRHDVRLFDMLQLCNVKPGTPLTHAIVRDRLKKRGLHPSDSTIQSALNSDIFAGGVMPTAEHVNDVYNVVGDLRYKSAQLTIDNVRSMKAYRETLQVLLYMSLSRLHGCAEVTHKTIARILGCSVTTVRRTVYALRDAGVMRVEATAKRWFVVQAGDTQNNTPSRNGKHMNALAWETIEVDGKRGVRAARNGVWSYILQGANRYVMAVSNAVTVLDTLLYAIDTTLFSPHSTGTQPPKHDTTNETPPIVQRLKAQQNTLYRHLHGKIAKHRAYAAIAGELGAVVSIAPTKKREAVAVGNVNVAQRHPSKMSNSEVML